MKTTNEQKIREAINEDYTSALAKNAATLLEVITVRTPSEHQQLYEVFSGFANLLPNTTETRSLKRMIEYYQDEFFQEADINEQDFQESHVS